MTQVDAQIRTAAELHNYLLKQENFDFAPDHDRDAALYRELKLSLGLPDGQFLSALRDQNVSAEKYLRALVAAAEPLAEMYREILDYCQRANFLRSKQGATIEWEIDLGAKQIGFSFEAFRAYEEIKRRVDPNIEVMRNAKNEIMNWLAHEVFAPSQQGLSKNNYDWSSVELFRILAAARNRAGDRDEWIFKGLNTFYLGSAGGRPSPEEERRVIEHPGYPLMLTKAQEAFQQEAIELSASKFINLPFWKFRWQVYEIWVITVSLAEFEKVGFSLATSSDARSLIELGTRATLAEHAANSSVFIYQPSYLNRNGADIKPDIVISRSCEATAADVQFIIECKQRLELSLQHVEEVRKKYESGVHQEVGQVVIVNYDDAPTWSASGPGKTTLIANVRPKSSGEAEFRRCLRASRVARSLRREAWFVDISMSMEEILDDKFRRLLDVRSQSLGPESFKLYGFALDVSPITPCDIRATISMSSSMDDANSEELGITNLITKVGECLKDSVLSLFIVSDLAAKIRKQLLVFDQLPERLHLIDPTKEGVLDIVNEGLH
jgi:hypothetical protein